MSDEHDAAKVTERPVEPPVIDVEAAEVAEEPAVIAAEAVAEEPPVIDVEAEVAGEEPAPEPIAEPERVVDRQVSGGAGSGRLWLAAGVAVAVIGAALWWLSYSGFRLARDDDRIAALTQRIEVLETTFGATRGEVAGLASRAAEIKASLDKVASQPPQALDEINARMGAIESALQSAQAAIEAAGKAASGAAAGSGEVVALTGRIEELQQKLAALEKASSAASEAQEAQAMKGNELAAALAGLDAPLAAGQPFAAELDKVVAVAPTLAGIEELRPHAATGAPTVADLTLRLQAIADRETGTPTASPAVGEQGLWTGLRSKISGLVTVRDLAEARWIDGTAAAAQAAAEGDIAQAVATLQAIEGPPPEELRAWLAEAQARMAVDRAARTMAEAARQETVGSP